MATMDDFQQLDIRVGRIVQAEVFPEGRHSTHIVQIDLGDELGRKKSLARLAPNYTDSELVGHLVLCVVNFPPRQIGRHTSEVLTLGVTDAEDNVVLIQPDRTVPLGRRLH